MKVLVVVDMQYDFIDGALGTPEAQAIVPNVAAAIRNVSDDTIVIFTKDTHEENYLSTQEGRNLPVPHCIRNTTGWQIRAELDALRITPPIDKPTFGSSALVEQLSGKEINSVTFVGLCTDICVISNVMLVKAFFPEVPVFVDALGCAGVTPESHRNALAAMKAVQVTVINE